MRFPNRRRYRFSTTERKTDTGPGLDNVFKYTCTAMRRPNPDTVRPRTIFTYREDVRSPTNETDTKFRALGKNRSRTRVRNAPVVQKRWNGLWDEIPTTGFSIFGKRSKLRLTLFRTFIYSFVIRSEKKKRIRTSQSPCDWIHIKSFCGFLFVILRKQFSFSYSRFRSYNLEYPKITYKK